MSRPTSTASSLLGLSLLVALLAACSAGKQPKAASGLEIDRILRSAKSVLWIAAHPDDENSSGGLLARARDLSGQLHMASLTRGENSDILWNGLRRGSQIGEARAALFAQSASIFQASFELGPFVNGPQTLSQLDAAPPNAPFRGWSGSARSEAVIQKWRGEADPIRYVVGILRARHPDVVITMDQWCGISGNLEHLATTRLLLEANVVAGDGSRDADLGSPWRVKKLIVNAHVLPALERVNYIKCEGARPNEPMHFVSSLHPSKVHSASYFRVACRVSKNYERTMRAQNWSDQEIHEQCATSEEAATKSAGDRVGPPVVEPYRVVSN